MTYEEVKAVLSNHGFTDAPGPTRRHPYLGSFLRASSSEGWCIAAHGSWHETPHLDVGLRLVNDLSHGTIGTIHRFFSIVGLQREVGEAVMHLESLAQQPHLLRCEKCGSRWVHLKESTPGSGRNYAFLSCDGMFIAGRKPNRGPLCDGTSERIPPRVPHQ